MPLNKSVLLSLALFLLAVIPLPAASSDLRTLLPPTVESVIYVPDVHRAINEFRFSRFGKFYQDESARDFLKPLRETLEGDSPELAALLSGESDPSDFPLDGSLLIARLAPAKKSSDKSKRDADKNSKSSKDESHPFVVIFHHNGDTAAAKKILDAALPKGDRRKIEKDSVAGLDFQKIKTVRYVKDEVKRSKNEEKNRLADSLAATPGMKVAGHEETREEHHFIGKQIAIRASREGFPMGDLLERLRYSTNAASLAKSPNYLGAIAELPADAPIQIYYDFDVVTQSGDPLVDESLLGRGGDASRLGLEEIRSAAMALSFTPERFNAEAHVFIPGPRKGLGRLFFMNTPLVDSDSYSTQSLATFVPDRATGYALFSSDLGEVWGEFRRIFRESVPAASDLVDSYLDSLSQNLDADIERDLLSKLGGQWVMFTSPVPGRSRQREVETTYMIEVRSADQMRPVLDRWLGKTAATLNYTLDTSEADGNIYYRITGAEVSEGAFADIQPFAKLCLTPDWLIISPRFEHIQSVVAQLTPTESVTPSVAPWRDAAWSRAVGYLPGDRFLEIYSSPDAFDSFVKDPFFGMFTGLFSGLEDSMVEFEETPKEDVWGQYFGPVAASVRAGENRLYVSLNLVSAE